MGAGPWRAGPARDGAAAAELQGAEHGPGGGEGGLGRRVATVEDEVGACGGGAWAWSGRSQGTGLSCGCSAGAGEIKSTVSCVVELGEVR